MLWSQQHPCRRAGRWSVWLRGAESPPEPPGGGGGGEGAVVTLHSGQSCRGTPGPRGSTADTGPTGQGAGQHGRIPPNMAKRTCTAANGSWTWPLLARSRGRTQTSAWASPLPPQFAPRLCTPVRTATCDPSWEPGIPLAPSATAAEWGVCPAHPSPVPWATPLACVWEEPASAWPVACIPPSAPWLGAVCAGSSRSGTCQPRLRSASARGQCST